MCAAGWVLSASSMNSSNRIDVPSRTRTPVSVPVLWLSNSELLALRPESTW
jgi:hypothetical protein